MARAGRLTDASLYAGVRLWQGANCGSIRKSIKASGLPTRWASPGSPAAKPTRKVSHIRIRGCSAPSFGQTIDLGGNSEKVDADINQFAGAQTANRLVLTIGRFSVLVIFRHQLIRQQPGKIDFLNWSLVNAGTFDYASDAWGFTYGAAAEWYQGDWAVRGGLFDLTVTPAGGNSPAGGDLDPTFDQFQMVGEIERRYQLWGQPGAVKVTGYLSRGRAGHFTDAVALAAVTGTPADINAVRSYTSRPGVSVNLQQQVSDTLGVFARAGGGLW